MEDLKEDDCFVRGINWIREFVSDHIHFQCI